MQKQKVSGWIRNSKSLLAGTVLMTAVGLSGVKVANAQSAPKGEASAESKEAVEQICSKIKDAYSSGNSYQLLDQYADDATVITPEGKKLNGRKEIAGYFEELKNVKSFTMEVTDITSSGKLISVLGKTTMTVDKNGTAIPREINFVLVLKRMTDWDYKIFLDSSSLVSLSYQNDSH